MSIPQTTPIVTWNRSTPDDGLLLSEEFTALYVNDNNLQSQLNSCGMGDAATVKNLSASINWLTYSWISGGFYIPSGGTQTGSPDGTTNKGWFVWVDRMGGSSNTLSIEAVRADSNDGYNTCWNSGTSTGWKHCNAPRSSTIVVSASNSTAKGIANADYQCTGASSGNTDDVIINQAIINASLLPNGGQVLFLEGTYYLYASIVAHTNVSLKGQGVGTCFLRNSVNPFSPITIASNVSNVTMADFLIDGNGGTYPCSIGCYGINSSATSNTFRFHNITVQNITTTAAIAAGFYNCNFLFNCLVSSMHGALQGIGFMNCNFVTNCTSNSNNTYGYSGCTRMQQNTGMGNTTALFSSCYADVSTNAAALSAAGGYNG